MMISVWILCIWIIDISLSVDAGMVTLANMTHIWSKGVIHRNQTDEGEVWQRPCHILLALPHDLN
jgi:hypothetical protein